MYSNRLVFARVMGHLTSPTVLRRVRRYHGQYKVKSFSCLDRYLCMAFAQLTYRESLRDIEAYRHAKPHHIVLRGTVSRDIWANAMEKRDWRVHADFAQALIAIARRLYAEDGFGVDLANTVYAHDATTIDLGRSWNRILRRDDVPQIGFSTEPMTDQSGSGDHGPHGSGRRARPSEFHEGDRSCLYTEQRKRGPETGLEPGFLVCPHGFPRCCWRSP